MIRHDLRSRIIPDVYLFPFFLSGLLLSDRLPWVTGGLYESVIAAAIGYVFGFTLNMAFKFLRRKKKDDYDPIGMGDVKLIAAGGAWLGLMGLFTAIVISCIAGAIWGATRKEKYIPFAPFFFVGGILSAIILWIF